MNHLEPQDALKQCDVVQKSLEPEITAFTVSEEGNGKTDVRVDCCLVTDEEIRKFNLTLDDQIPSATNKYVPDSVSVCHRTFRPEWALEALGYSFKLARWESADSTDPPGLTWDQLTGQICANRPFISVKLWDEGGTHAEVVTGYHVDPDTMNMVDLESAGMDGFHSIPFKHYQGKPGDNVHVRDYYDIFRIGR